MTGEGEAFQHEFHPISTEQVAELLESVASLERRVAALEAAAGTAGEGSAAGSDPS